ESYPLSCPEQAIYAPKPGKIFGLTGRARLLPSRKCSEGASLMRRILRRLFGCSEEQPHERHL
ncbi:MAG: hypothetical protein ACK40X_14735, partial [Armatimonadota bacterium]